MWLTLTAARKTWTTLFYSGENRKASGNESQSSLGTDRPFQRKETKVKDMITCQILQLRKI